MKNLKSKKSFWKRLSMPHAFTMLLAILFIFGILSIILSGTETGIGDDKIITAGILDWFASIGAGFNGAIWVIIFLFALGGFINVLIETKALDAFIGKLATNFKTKIDFAPESLKKKNIFAYYGKNFLEILNQTWVIIVLIIFFSFAGTTYGMAEESIAFYAIIIPLALAAGFDVWTGFLIIFIGAGVGVMASTINPFSVLQAIASSKESLQNEASKEFLKNGILFRWIAWFLFTLITIVFVVWYAMRVKINKEKSETKDLFEVHSKVFATNSDTKITFTRRHLATMLIFLFVFLFMTITMFQWDNLTGSKVKVEKFKDFPNAKDIQESINKLSAIKDNQFAIQNNQLVGEVTLIKTSLVDYKAALDAASVKYVQTEYNTLVASLDSLSNAANDLASGTQNNLEKLRSINTDINLFNDVKINILQKEIIIDNIASLKTSLDLKGDVDKLFSLEKDGNFIGQLPEYRESLGSQFTGTIASSYDSLTTKLLEVAAAKKEALTPEAYSTLLNIDTNIDLFNDTTIKAYDNVGSLQHLNNEWPSSAEWIQNPTFQNKVFGWDIFFFGGWYFEALVAYFVIATLVIAIINWKGEKHFIETFMTGAKDMLGVAFAVGIAGSIKALLDGTNMTGFFVKKLSGAIATTDDDGNILAATKSANITIPLISYIAFIPLTFLIPSTSGLAKAAFPVWAPTIEGAKATTALSGTITAYGWAAGWANLFVPTYGVVIGALAATRIPYGHFLKSIWKFLLLMFVVGLAFIIIGGAINNGLAEGTVFF